MEFPLHKACLNNEPRKVQELLESSDPFKAVVQRDDDGRVPLHWAVSMFDFEFFKGYTAIACFLSCAMASKNGSMSCGGGMGYIIYNETGQNVKS